MHRFSKYFFFSDYLFASLITEEDSSAKLKPSPKPRAFKLANLSFLDQKRRGDKVKHRFSENRNVLAPLK